MSPRLSPDGTPIPPGYPPPLPPPPPRPSVASWAWAAVDVWAFMLPAALLMAAFDFAAWAAWLDHPLTT